MHRHLPDYRSDEPRPLDSAGFLLFGAGIALLSYVLEVVGEHTLGATPLLALLATSVALLTVYGLRATRIASAGQQLSISFGVASASLVTAIFIPDRYRASPAQMIGGFTRDFWCWGR